MYNDNKVLIGKSVNKELYIVPNMANRHGLITGASGSGKTITLKVMAESFSSMGVPVFLADIKGDLAATCMPGEASEKLEERLKKLNIENFQYKGFPVVFWDVFEKNGHPLRTPIQNIDIVILSKMLGLNEVQSGVLSIVFRIARENNYEIIDIKDLRLVLQFVADNAKDYTTQYGNVASQSIGTIQRALLKLEDQGGDYLFGEPGININDFMKLNNNGMGNINILDSTELYQKPDLYASFLLWLLSTLNTTLPEVGDMDKPKIVFFFDEAHLLFNEIQPDMLQKVIQIVKLIRSKGVGLYFISQSPSDIPNEILAQLGNKIQHTLRAYTPQEQKVVKAVADSFRTNPEFDTQEAIMGLGTGEALISFLNEKGEPNIVEKATILPPQSMMGALDDSMRLMIINRSEFKGKYDTEIDRESAFEIITKDIQEEEARKEQERQEKEKAKLEEQQRKEEEKKQKEEEKELKAKEKAKKEAEKEAEKKRKKSISYKIEKQAGRTANSMLNSIGRKVANEIFKSIFK
jgi:DNA helicase HerA-like ATPase